jgi:hypothetical protein
VEELKKRLHFMEKVIWKISERYPWRYVDGCYHKEGKGGEELGIRIDGWIVGRKNHWMEREWGMDRWTNGQTDWWMSLWTDGWKDNVNKKYRKCEEWMKVYRDFRNFISAWTAGWNMLRLTEEESKSCFSIFMEVGGLELLTYVTSL